MNTTAFIRKNILAAVAVALIAGFSAFKIIESPKVQQSNWYEVNNGNIPSSDPLDTPPSDDPTADCSTEKTTNMCAIQIELVSGQPFPSTVAEAQSNHNVLNDAFRD